ncbi:MAG: GGDEF domain-containing protein [Methylophilaceae bacterium]
MDKNSKSIEIARQTLLQLTARKIPPTPDNYRSVYDEISGIVSIDHSKELARTLDSVLQEAGHKQPKYIVAAQAIANQIEKRDWAKLEDQLRKLIPVGATDGENVSWPMVLRNLLRQLEVSHKGITVTRKKEGLNKVLTNFGQDPDLLVQKIHGLVSSWGTGAATEGAIETPASASPIVQNSAGASTATTQKSIGADGESGEFAGLWRDMVIKSLDLVLIPQLKNNPGAEARAKTLLAGVQSAKTKADVQAQAEALKSILFTCEMQHDAQNRMHEALLQILRLLLASMGELVIEDKWLHGQILLINDILSLPLNIEVLYNAESSLKDLIFKQGKIKPGLVDAQETLKRMASTFVDRLVDLAETTDDYQAKIQGYQQKITTTKDIHELNTLLDNLMEDTRVMGLSAQRSRDILTETQQKVKEAELKIIELTNQLEHISEVAHEDYLTGTLNRRGMDEALEREFSRAERYNVALSIAMMDIDHFKKINDTMGHTTGDQALAHLANVIKKTLRTTDVIARYGGEEFIIILPGTELSESITIVTRAQRELTRNFFMHNNERVLITFSAGVAQRLPGEDVNAMIPRADAALYQAKQSGRNRVIGAEMPDTEIEPPIE